MKHIGIKLLTLVLTLSMIFISGASASVMNTAWVTVPSSEWEETFLMVITALEMHENPVFAVTEYPEYDPDYRFAHELKINDFLKLTYYDNGDDVFNSAVLEIDLSYPEIPIEVAWGAIFAVLVSGDPDSTDDQWIELISAICPKFDEVLSGEERLSGAQAATLNGIGYMMELNDDARLARFFANASVTTNN